MSYPISDLATRVRNAYLAGRKRVKIPHSRNKEAIIKILKDEGYIKDMQVKKKKVGSEIIVELKYEDGIPVIEGIKLVSKPGRRIYSSSSKIPRTLGGYGLTILSTNRGIMSRKQAKKMNLGGEVICKVW